jgi:hypothetical protein
MKIPESMTAALAAWNNGKGIDLESWIGCEGNFSLAVGYTTIFWPDFVEFDGYILRNGFSEESLRAFEKREASNRKSVESLMNHLHIADVQYLGCADASADKLLLLGKVLEEIYQAKLQWQFPDKPCTVHLFIPDDPEKLTEYQISFWQNGNT